MNPHFDAPASFFRMGATTAQTKWHAQTKWQIYLNYGLYKKNEATAVTQKALHL